MNLEEKKKNDTKRFLFFNFGLVAMGQMFFELFLIPSYFSLPPLLSYCLWAFVPFPSHLLPVLLSFSQFWFLLTLLSTFRHVFFLFGSYHHHHHPFIQLSVTSEHLLALHVFSRHKGATSQVTYMLLAEFIARKHSKWERFVCGSSCQVDFGYSHIRVHRGALVSKGSLHLNLPKPCNCNSVGCLSSEAAANLTWAEKLIFLSLTLSSNSL